MSDSKEFHQKFFYEVFWASRETESQGEVLQAEKLDLKKPSRYAVILHNDDYTSMEFVIEVLIKFFKKSGEHAYQVMMDVHQSGKGVAGIYSFDIAETKVTQVHQLARSKGYPLLCTYEEMK